MTNRPIITLTTDFGLNDHFVGTMKGVILNLCPEAEIIDISHAVQAYDILDGALTIAQSYSHFPSETIHIVVVDPGVGSARRPIIAVGERHFFVAPDNGVLSLVYARERRLRVHHITAEHYFLHPVSQTFHGRDIFAPVGARLARGVDLSKFGEEITDFARLSLPRPKVLDANTIRGIVLKVDRFGNLITNLTPRDFPALFTLPCPPFRIAVGQREVTRICTSYAEGTPNELFAILGSMGFLEIAANRASAAQLAGASKGGEVTIVMEGAAAAGNFQ